MFIEFEKWQACANDFVVFNLSSSEFSNVGPSLQRKARDLCHRHTGVGADGIILIMHPQKGEAHKLLIINSDGTIARTCGNGIRCAALSVYQQSLLRSKTKLESIDFLLESQSYTCQIIPQKGPLPLVQVGMGIPSLNEENEWDKDARSFLKQILTQAQHRKFLENVHTCSLANRHLVFLLEEEVSPQEMRELGALLQNSPYWDGINVNFVSPLQSGPAMPGAMRNLDLADAHKVFIWERGAGETFACGSGACAVATALLSTNLIERSSWIPTLFPGGWLFAKQDEDQEEVLLSGAADFVFSGKLEI